MQCQRANLTPLVVVATRHTKTHDRFVATRTGPISNCVTEETLTRAVGLGCMTSIGRRAIRTRDWSLQGGVEDVRTIHKRTSAVVVGAYICWMISVTIRLYYNNGL